MDETTERLRLEQIKHLRRDLITKEIQKELKNLRNEPSLKTLLETQGDDNNNPNPFVRFFFQNFVQTFPFLKESDATIWSKLEEFLGEIAKLRFSNYATSQKEKSQRERLALKAEKLFVLLFNTSIKVVKPPAQYAVEQAQQEQVPPIPPRRYVSEDDYLKTQPGTTTVDVIGVRKLEEKAILNKTRTEFLVQCHLNGDSAPICSWRKHSEFRKLYTKLRREFPSYYIPSPPQKYMEKHGFLYREKDRISLRSYIRTLVALPSPVGNSPIVLEFLTMDPAQINADELKDVELRKNTIKARLEEQRKFMQLAEEKAKDLEQMSSALRQDLLQSGGLQRMSQVLYSVDQISDLPEHYFKSIEQMRVSFAFTLYRMYCFDEEAPHNLQRLKHTHALIPYRTLKTVLKLSNPTAVVKAVLDLFLAQPFKKPSLMQRIININLGDRVKQSQTESDALREAIADDQLSDKIKNYVYSEGVLQCDGDSGSTEMQTIVQILNDNSVQPEISPEKIVALWQAQEVMDNPPSTFVLEPDNQQSTFPHFDPAIHEAKLQLERLNRLLTCLTHQRNIELFTKLMLEGVTGEIFKQILAIVYKPLARIYKDAKIENFIMDISRFVDDLIKTVEEYEEQDVTSEHYIDPIKSFTELIKRHDQNLYRFIHNLYKQQSEGIFKRLIEWFDKILFNLREGVVTEPIDLDQLVHENIKPSDRPELASDLDKLADYNQKRKARQHRKLRKKIMHGMGLPSNPDGTDDNWAIPEMDQFIQSNQLPVSSDDIVDFMYPWQDSSDDESLVGTFSSMKVSNSPGRKSPRFKPKIKEPKVPYPQLSATTSLVQPFARLAQERFSK
ncbi:hypothetical protein K493DRAFT_407992 [Basidiobolus meristosporus CBS 931.73]|uniref:PX domain-containing protein n=1 Tax=Basidiobolus meristosporus CBS 931.73 TaxID=1314790 RepID=A0A1Y1Y8X0_9FUNG|nr:hypothetical protein K493DRAFT_407992 [Basidiobolus meristosporus CBS 931.73]|eukprot:ORX94437.1 hypothetical protein K493DRAFT_407992 [Basidiobolus meristosporus CBS 931.73]